MICFGSCHAWSSVIVIADVPLKKLEAYYEIYNIERECDMSQFARSKIPGFNPARGYGYCEIRMPVESAVPQSTIILMNKVGFSKQVCSIITSSNNFSAEQGTLLWSRCVFLCN